eukprot:1441856-Amphidinium_carterae.1
MDARDAMRRFPVTLPYVDDWEGEEPLLYVVSGGGGHTGIDPLEGMPSCWSDELDIFPVAQTCVMRLAFVGQIETGCYIHPPPETTYKLQFFVIAEEVAGSTFLAALNPLWVSDSTYLPSTRVDRSICCHDLLVVRATWHGVVVEFGSTSRGSSRLPNSVAAFPTMLHGIDLGRSGLMLCAN